MKGWSTLFCKQVHSSGIGGLKSRLKNSLETPVVIKRTEPTTISISPVGRNTNFLFQIELSVATAAGSTTGT